MKQKSPSPILRPLAFLLCFITICLTFSWGELLKSIPVQSDDADPPPKSITIVLDAGHGGEDGGAVGRDGAVIEKDLNLKITLLLAEMMRANGFDVVLTREKDELLYDRSINYQGRKKALDLAARKSIAEKTENAVFISIHMNTHPVKSCRGLQVWYSPNHEASEGIAKSIQSTVQNLMQPQSERGVKEATSRIYLLHTLNIPAVLIECGFLSNDEEAELLTDSQYQRQLALSIFLSLTSKNIV